MTSQQLRNPPSPLRGPCVRLHWLCLRIVLHFAGFGFCVEDRLAFVPRALHSA